MAKEYSEDALIEQPAIGLFGELGWATVNAYGEFDQGKSTLGRENAGEAVLLSRLRPALARLNPALPPEALQQAAEEVTRDRGKMSLAAANREVYALLKDGVKVSFKDATGQDQTDAVRLVDWQDPKRNDFLLVSQFWVAGEMYKRRADLVGFVNGLPLVFVELKAAHKALRQAYDNNLKDYKVAVPQLFWANGLVILSNGSHSRVGSVTSEWEHFSEWKRINSEGEKGAVSLETMIRGTCEPGRLLDLVENFTLFKEVRGGLIKVVAMNHQYLGVNNALAALRGMGANKGRLGVFWHTQGSGKSISMIFFAQKVLRTVPGHWTFVVVTDRQELDDQIYKNFADAGAVTEKQVQATSGEDLKRLLKEDHRYVFTLIQKFRTEGGGVFPKLSERDDIIVMTDEAHRSQYDTFALNMRRALPRAAFIGFTGTPLMIGEEKTRQVFGDYVSIYNFQQSIADGATVPLYYENRIPELQLTNPMLNEDMARLLEDADLDEEQEKKLERDFAKEYHLITREDRLERVARDIVEHYMGRDFTSDAGPGKAMVVCIDKATAVMMYDKVRKHWQAHRQALQDRMLQETNPLEAKRLGLRIGFMDQTDMAVVVSQAQNEAAEMSKKGVDITPHRKRMVTEDLEKKFKDPADPFRIVFVCAMWMTGFDVPCCATIYLDKPMRNHTLMQTIARANRVFRDKVNGLIVDYVGVFRDLQRALAIYAPAGGGVDRPVQDKQALVGMLRKVVKAAGKFCKDQGVDLPGLLEAKAFAKVAAVDDAVKALILKADASLEGPLDDSVDAILINDQSRAAFLQHVDQVNRVYRAIKPDPAAFEFQQVCALLVVLAEKIRALRKPVEIGQVMEQVDDLLDHSVSAKGYSIRDAKPVDLGKIDFAALQPRSRKAASASSWRACGPRSRRSWPPCWPSTGAVTISTRSSGR